MFKEVDALLVEVLAGANALAAVAMHMNTETVLNFIFF